MKEGAIDALIIHFGREKREPSAHSIHILKIDSFSRWFIRRHQALRSEDSFVPSEVMVEHAKLSWC